jgi:hypothetical protein
VLALFIGQSALAYAAPCTHGTHGTHADESSDSCPEEEDEGTCPCPIQCASSCAGNALRAIPPSMPLLGVHLPACVELLLSTIDRAPPPSEPAEILHVPKRDRA